MISLEARGGLGERKKRIAFQTTEEGIQKPHKTSGGDGEWYRVDAAVRVNSVETDTLVVCKYQGQDSR